MESVLNLNWAGIFMPQTPFLEIIVRGTVIYLGILVLMRILPRQAGAVGLADILFIILVADAAQNGMAGDYTSIADGFILICTLMFWNYALEWLGYYFPKFEKLTHPSPLQLIKNGKINRRNMRSELISIDELMSHLREQGIDKVEDVKTACVEGDGQISVVKFDTEQHAKKKNIH